MRLWVHTDLDGVFCAVLLSEMEEVDEIRFVDPGTVQAGKIFFNKYDIIADLPFDRRCGLWFDHHESSRPGPERKFEGAWAAAPSAARVIYNWAENPYLEKFAAALEEVDKIDSGLVPIEQAREPTGWFLLSNTLEMSPEKKVDDEYRIHVIQLLRKNPDVEAALRDEKVAVRAGLVKEDLEKFAKLMKQNTIMMGKVAFSDLRKLEGLPRGNNYLIYSLFPDAVTSVRLMPERENKDMVKLSVGHNIYRAKKSEFDVGAAMRKMGGGGHKPVGGASVKLEDAEKLAMEVIRQVNEFEAGT